jgi:hypothetical protein
VTAAKSMYLRKLRSRRGRGGGDVVKHDEVDVARIVELVAAHLAERQHEIAAPLLGPLRVGGIERAGAGGLAQEMPHRQADGRVGKPRQRGGDTHDRPHAAGIGDRDQERGFRLEAAQQLHDAALVAGRCGRCGGAGQDILEASVGIGLQQRQEPRRIRPHEVPKIGRAVGEDGDQFAHGRMIGQELRQDSRGRLVHDVGEPGLDARLQGVRRRHPRGRNARGEQLFGMNRGLRRARDRMFHPGPQSDHRAAVRLVQSPPM